MIVPSLLPVLSPVVLYFIILQIGGMEGFIILRRYVAGCNNYRPFRSCINDCGGGAWDNAKKYIEDGNFGGKVQRLINQQLLEIQWAILTKIRLALR